MGYSHYWTQQKPIEPAAWQAICDAFRKLRTTALIVGQQLPPIQFENAVPEPVEITDSRIRFNGVGNDGHETMVLRRDQMGFHCCKTADKPYDLWVTALLTLAHFHAPGTWDFSSDGDEADWLAGVKLVRTLHPEAGNPIQS